ncbi:ZZEF1 isoform 12, partial [Pan troglodytes]
ASLLAEWPSHVPVSEDILELSGPAHMTYILDMFMQLEEKHEWEKANPPAWLGTPSRTRTLYD